MKNRYIMLENGIEVELPMYETYDERESFCENIINTNLQDFEYDLPMTKVKNNFMERVIRRLDSLSYYLCELSNRKDREMITERQEEYYQNHKNNPKNGRFYNNYDDI